MEPPHAGEHPGVCPGHRNPTPRRGRGSKSLLRHFAWSRDFPRSRQTQSGSPKIVVPKQWSSDIGEDDFSTKLCRLHPSGLESVGVGQGLGICMFYILLHECKADALGTPGLGLYYSKCGLWTTPYQHLLRACQTCRISGFTPDLLNHSRHLNKIPRGNSCGR